MSIEYLAQGFIVAAQVLAGVSLPTIGMSWGEAVSVPTIAVEWCYWYEFQPDIMEFRDKPG